MTEIQATLGTGPNNFVDLSLRLAKHERLADGSQVCDALGTHQEVEVGFRFRLPAKWTKGSFGSPGITTYQAVIDIESIGAASDRFVVTLGDLYQGALHPQQMAKSIRFTAISLQGEPRYLEKGPVKIKLFFEPEEDNEEAADLYYAEHYLNIDLKSQVVEFHEKDESYRDAILRALSGAAEP